MPATTLHLGAAVPSPPQCPRLGVQHPHPHPHPHPRPHRAHDRSPPRDRSTNAIKSDSRMHPDPNRSRPTPDWSKSKGFDKYMRCDDEAVERFRVLVPAAHHDEKIGATFLALHGPPARVRAHNAIAGEPKKEKRKPCAPAASARAHDNFCRRRSHRSQRLSATHPVFMSTASDSLTPADVYIQSRDLALRCSPRRTTRNPSVHLVHAARRVPEPSKYCEAAHAPLWRPLLLLALAVVRHFVFVPRFAPALATPAPRTAIPAPAATAGADPVLRVGRAGAVAVVATVEAGPMHPAAVARTRVVVRGTSARSVAAGAARKFAAAVAGVGMGRGRAVVVVYVRRVRLRVRVTAPPSTRM
ncbi:hypothetical protein B0H14DRAFT_3447011 [Mycena olivaceomarginata]|nr:hypothetical protein B0H14DRAFT_3447011 [Mycena olivaceomarginata]